MIWVYCISSTIYISWPHFLLQCFHCFLIPFLETLVFLFHQACRTKIQSKEPANFQKLFSRVTVFSLIAKIIAELITVTWQNPEPPSLGLCWQQTQQHRSLNGNCSKWPLRLPQETIGTNRALAVKHGCPKARTMAPLFMHAYVNNVIKSW